MNLGHNCWLSLSSTFSWPEFLPHVEFLVHMGAQWNHEQTKKSVFAPCVLVLLFSFSSYYQPCLCLESYVLLFSEKYHTTTAFHCVCSESVWYKLRYVCAGSREADNPPKGNPTNYVNMHYGHRMCKLLVKWQWNMKTYPSKWFSAEVTFDLDKEKGALGINGMDIWEEMSKRLHESRVHSLKDSQDKSKWEGERIKERCNKDLTDDRE